MADSVFAKKTLQDCVDDILNLTINRTFDDFEREKSVVNDGLAKIFPNLTFEESDPELDHASDTDYVAKVLNKSIGIQNLNPKMEWFQALPSQFDCAKYIYMACQMKIPASTADKQIARFLAANLFVSQAQGEYSKTAMS